MLGGGYFVSQNKKLPGSYINFVSLKNATATLGDRGVVALPLELDWGPEAVQKVTLDDLVDGCLKIFGYSYDDAALIDIREVFRHAVKLITYRLNGGGVKASNTFGAAKYAGTRGNKISIAIAVNADDGTKWDVTTYLDGEKVDEQIGVANAAALVDNDFVDFDGTATLAATTGTFMTGGTNSAVTGTQHSAALSAFEQETFNVLGCPSDNGSIQALYTAYTIRMVENVGKKFQLVIYNNAADHEHIINEATALSLVPWTCGAEAGCAVNKSLTNTKYDGEKTISVAYTQQQLEDAVDAGKLVFHLVDNEHRILTDINSLVTTTSEKSDDFKLNQVVRVMDQIGNDIAANFNAYYLGKEPNDVQGRTAFWNTLRKYFEELLKLRAIEDFDAVRDIAVSKGDAKTAVVVDTQITVVGCMEKLYMTVYVA